MSVTPSSVRRVAAGLERFLLPAGCLHCARPLDAGRQRLGLCLPCRGALKRPAPGCAVCGAPLAAARLRPMADDFPCGRCRERPPAFERLRVAWSYEGPLPSVVTGLKYRRLDYLGAHLAEELAAMLSAVAPGGESGRSGVGGWDFVVPVPLHWRRRWWRGFNQAERIARPLAGLLGVRLRTLLRRARSTRPQARLARRERLANPSGAFALRRCVWAPSGIVAARVLLVDDVVTTGATLDAAARALLDAGAAEVIAVAAARTPETA